MKRRGLTPEEKQLWDYVTRSDVPLPRSRKAETQKLEVQKIKKIAKNNASISAFLPSAPQATDSQQLAISNYAGIDRNTADRFRKGKFPLDATLDLHGMTREKAYKILAGFIKNHYERGSRFVLVITGKGQKQSRDGEPSARGVLNSSLPRWLDEPDLKPLILAFDTARQPHGGSGAYYILLRRRR